jgi:hypothetical protein
MGDLEEQDGAKFSVYMFLLRKTVFLLLHGLHMASPQEARTVLNCSWHHAPLVPRSKAPNQGLVGAPPASQLYYLV